MKQMRSKAWPSKPVAGLTSNAMLPHALLGGALARGRDRRVVIIQADEARLGDRLRHCDRGGAVSAADVGDPGAALQALDDAVKRWQPLAHQMRAIAGAEEALGAAEQRSPA